MARTAIVIGAGSAGLTALHAMTQAGFDTICLERNSSYGGIWLTTRYPKLAIHSKSLNYRFFDFHSVASVGDSATRAEILAYFADFIQAKGLTGKISYQERVLDVIYRKGRATQKCMLVVAQRSA